MPQNDLHPVLCSPSQATRTGPVNPVACSLCERICALSYACWLTLLHRELSGHALTGQTILEAWKHVRIGTASPGHGSRTEPKLRCRLGAHSRTLRC